jgi:peptidoglycan/LPS O-acetylase OafA/YrhL
LNENPRAGGSPTTLVAVVIYLALALLWIYGVLNRDRSDERMADDTFWNSYTAALLVGGVVAATGFLVGRWWAPALALLPAILALPAGYEPDGYPEVPIWLYLGAQGLIFGVPLMAAAVALRWIERAIRGRPGAPSGPGSALPAASRTRADRP